MRVIWWITAVAAFCVLLWCFRFRSIDGGGYFLNIFNGKTYTIYNNSIMSFEKISIINDEERIDKITKMRNLDWADLDYAVERNMLVCGNESNLFSFAVIRGDGSEEVYVPRGELGEFCAAVRADGCLVRQLKR